MTDRPRPGLCSVCHVEARAPGQPRCTACQTGWERRAASTTPAPANRARVADSPQDLSDYVLTNFGIKLTTAEREALQGDP